MKGGIDWPGLLRAGLHGLRLSPEAFWRLTPIELRILLGREGGRPLTRARLAELAAAFPDEQHRNTRRTGKTDAGAEDENNGGT